MSLKNIDARTLKTWLDNNEAILVDVREPTEHSTKKITDTILLPLGKVCLEKLPKLGDKKLVIHCLKGGRGQSACKKLLSDKFDADIYNLEGGIEAWEEAGLPVEESISKALPLDRQLHLIIGLLIVASVALAHFVDQSFIFAAGFFGLGLVFAGLTGICALRSFIAKMPWNRRG